MTKRTILYLAVSISTAVLLVSIAPFSYHNAYSVLPRLPTALKEHADTETLSPPSNGDGDRSAGKEENISMHLGSWTVYWDEESHSNMIENADIFGHVYPYWYALDSFGKVIETVTGSELISSRMKAYRRLDYTVIPMIYCGNDSTYSHLFDNPTLREQHIEDIRNIVIDNGYHGIEINYEAIPYGKRYDYVSFIEDLRVALNSYNKTLSVALYPRWTDNRTYLECDSYLYEPLANASDQVKIMAYNEHWSTHDRAGPIASYEWVRSIIEYAISKIPSEKIILGVPPSDTIGLWMRKGTLFPALEYILMNGQKKCGLSTVRSVSGTSREDSLSIVMKRITEPTDTDRPITRTTAAFFISSI